MIRACLLVLTSLALIAADAPTADKADKKDEDLIQGTWSLESAMHGGKAVPAEELAKLKITFKGDKTILAKGGEQMEQPFKLDASKKPKQIDVEFKEGKGVGIYELDGDTLKICHSEIGSERPKEFKSAEGSKDTLMVLKREKK